MAYNQTAFIETFTGKKVFFEDPSPNSICIEDIAHSLSMQCRYNGHCLRFASVAEHCVLLCENFGWGNEDAYALLMHDASEAYLSDLPRPVKYTLPSYRELEAKFDAVIAKKFNVTNMHSDAVRNWDQRIILDERAQNMSKSGNDWQTGDATPLGIALKFWDPAQAEGRFLQNFHRLNRLLNG